MRKSSVFGLLSLLIIISSCTEFRKIQKNPDWKVRYIAAKKYYEQEDYYRASVLLEDIIPIIKGSNEAEEAEYLFAYAHFHQKQYLLAAHHFKSFVRVYSRSDHAEEASFMHAYSLYMESPKYNLDQKSTYEAISVLQGYLNRYPYSENAEKATKIIDELQEKLETKAYENSMQYLKLRRYKSAIIAFENFQKDFPDSRFNEEISYRLIEAEFRLARQSIQSVQEERFRATIKFYENFIDSYPDSKFVKDAENMYSSSVSELSRIKS